jgi:hypothetical protein
MSYLPKFGPLPLLAMAVVLCLTGCPQSQDQVSASANPAVAQDQASDPAAANLAPADSNGQAPANTGGSYDQSSYDPGYGAQPVAYADQPPPPLPDYDQPPAPGDDYLWTPGYWAWAPDRLLLGARRVG